MILGNPFQVLKIKVYGACTRERRRYVFTVLLLATKLVIIIVVKFAIIIT